MGQMGRLLGNSSKWAYQVVGSWSENVESWTARIRGRILCIRFEDLLENPERQFSGVVDFLGMNATPEQVAKASENSINSIIAAYQRGGGRTAARMSPLELLRSGAALRGKRLLTTQQIATIAGANLNQMQRFGYWK
jgi:hypothetical protein